MAKLVKVSLRMMRKNNILSSEFSMRNIYMESWTEETFLVYDFIFPLWPVEDDLSSVHNIQLF